MTEAIKINANDGVTRNVMVGAETTVDFDFPIYDATHIELYETDTAGVITKLVKDTDFTVPAGSVNVQAGGTLNLDGTQYPSGATAGHVFTAYQAAPYSRTTDFNEAGDFFADTLNQELDLITQQLQQIKRDLARAPLAPVDTTLTALTLPDPQNGYLLAWDGVTGNLNSVALSSITTVDFDTVFSGLAAEDFLKYNGSNWINRTPTEVRTDLGLGDLATSIITGETSATIATADEIIFSDADDSSDIKKDTVQGILDLVPAASTTVSGVVEKATQAELEAETADKYPDAASLRYSPGVAKFWVRFDQIGTLAVEASYNVTGVADDGTGNSTITIEDDFSDAEICVSAMCIDSAGTATFGTFAVCDTFAAGAVTVFTRDNAGNAKDMDPVMVTGFGDQ